jgi:hypothetical protein
MDFLAVTPTVAVGKDRVNEYFDVREYVVTVFRDLTRPKRDLNN